jgi:ParB family chromosome partitioning protein
MPVMSIPLSRVVRNEEQPRQTFPEDHIANLAASIRENGLLQPITVRPLDGGTFQIIAGECRSLACRKLGREEIEANVIEATDADMDILAILENLQRRDINLIDEARAYQRQLDKGWTVEDLAKRLGVRDGRIRDRVALLGMRDKYQDLAAKGGISPYAAGFLARLTPDRQDRLFKAISAGKCEGWVKLKAAADALYEEQQQVGMFEDAETGKLSEDDENQLRALERKIDTIAAMVSQGFNKDGGVDVARKVAPHRASDMADKLELIQSATMHLIKELRKAAAQAELV